MFLFIRWLCFQILYFNCIRRICLQLKMTERTDQRICIKFCFNLGKSCTETIEMIQKAFVDESMGITQINEWYRWFENGRTSLDSDHRSGWPSLTTTPENIEHVRLTIEGDRRLTVRQLVNYLGIPGTIAWEILNKILGMNRACAVTGFFTTITRQRIHKKLCSYFWRNTRLFSFASLRTVST